MDQRIKDIIKKPDTEAVHIDDMIYVIGKYIEEKKGKMIKIMSPDQNHPAFKQIPQAIFAQMILAPEVNKIAYGFSIAQTYFLNQK